MRQLKTLSFMLAATLLISGCGHHLGSYALDGVQAVRRLPASFPEGAQSYGKFIEVRIASPTSLTAFGGKVDSVYVRAGYCSSGNPDLIVALGPVSDSGARLGVLSLAADLQPGEDGQFRYRIFLVPAHPMPRTPYSATALAWPKYDLLSNGKDVCVRLFAPGYNLTESRSRTVTIPIELIKAALAEDP